MIYRQEQKGLMITNHKFKVGDIVQLNSSEGPQMKVVQSLNKYFMLGVDVICEFWDEKSQSNKMATYSQRELMLAVVPMRDEDILKAISKVEGLGGMSVNERLSASGLMDEFDRLRTTDKQRAQWILKALRVDQPSIDKIVK